MQEDESVKPGTLNWTLNQKLFGIYTLKAIAYDIEGRTVEDQMDLLIINFGLTITGNNGNTLSK